MIEVLKETTGQVADFRYPENIYYVDKKSGKLVAFYPENSDELKVFTKPMKFDKRRRSFDLIGNVKSVG